MNRGRRSVAPAAGSAAAELERWPLPGRTNPASAVGAADGTVWFTTHAGVGRVDRNGRVARFRVRGGDLGDLIPGPDGVLYATVLTEAGVYRDGVVRIDLDGRSRFVHYRGQESGITAVAPGPEGDLWAATEAPRAAVRMTTAGTMTARTRLSGDAEIQAMATAPDGTLGFVSEAGVGRVFVDGRLALTKAGDFSQGDITATPDGSMWAMAFDTRRLVRLAADGSVAAFPVGVTPQSVTTGPDGSVWFAFETRREGGVGRIRGDGTGLQLWREPFGTDGPDMIAFDGQGDLWGTAFDEYSLERLDLAPPAQAAGPLQPFLRRTGLLRQAYTLRAGVDGSMWATTREGVVRIDATGAQRLYSAGPLANASQVLPQADGTVWIAFGGRGVARLTPDGRVRWYSKPFRKRTRIFAMTRGRDGRFWLLDKGRTVLRWTPGHRAHRITSGLGHRRDLLTIAAGTHNRTWVTDQHGAILAISRRGHVHRYTRGLGRHPEPTAITPGPDGNMWFTMFSRRRVGRITPSGHVRLWRTRESPASITTGPDGALWFTTAAVSLFDTINGLGRIDTRGRQQEFFVRPSLRTGFDAIATGADHKLWFLVARGPVAIARMDPTRAAEIGAIR